MLGLVKDVIILNITFGEGLTFEQRPGGTVVGRNLEKRNVQKWSTETGI